LARRLASVEEAALRERLRDPENVALFEEGAYQAARAISEERRQRIAELVAAGIADDRRDYIESHRLLRLLGELDDGEVIILAGYLRKKLARDYWDRHANVLHTPTSPRDDIALWAIRRAGGDNLRRLGLLSEGPSWRLESDPAPPVGTPVHNAKLSPLGRLLLTRIGLASEGDR
jgi:hypothetical protein